jgi:hypothetical protein
MNDFQMSHLATSHFDGLRAEADRQRLVRAPERKPEPSKAERSHHPRRFALVSLIRRAVA